MAMSQAELARRVGISQPAINALIRGASRSSTHLHRIARELDTTPAYLTGEIDDASISALPPPRPAIQHVLLPVALPSERALARMFEGLLDLVDCSVPKAELARELAQLLPIGLSQLKAPLIEPDLVALPEEAVEAFASADHEPHQ
jgi:transcriptional regulator with XRE-family HTH domain